MPEGTQSCSDTLAPMSAPNPTVAPLLDAYQTYAAAQTFSTRRPSTLYEPIRYAMATRGKAVRPMLLLLTHAIGASTPEAALPAAYAVELFHNFTLLHDDIMDQAQLRRGQPAVHAAFGIPAAILAGDTMLIHTYGYLTRHYGGQMSQRLLERFQSMAEKLCEGQQRDMDLEASQEATYAEYLSMIHGKTGVLITTALELGAIIANLPADTCAGIREAGDLAGRAFQIQDDVLDTFSTAAATGKSDYGDIVRAKQSAPYVRALELAAPAQRQRLLEIYAADTAERSSLIAEVLAIFADLNVENMLRQEVSELSREANKLLKSALPTSPQAQALIDFTEQLARRAF